MICVTAQGAAWYLFMHSICALLSHEMHHCLCLLTHTSQHDSLRLVSSMCLCKQAFIVVSKSVSQQSVICAVFFLPLHDDQSLKLCKQHTMQTLFAHMYTMMYQHNQS